MKRPLDKKDVVKVTDGKMSGKSGTIVRMNEDGSSACVVLTKVWDHGIWFSTSELKRCGKIK